MANCTIKCVIVNDTEFDLVTTGAHEHPDDPLNFILSNGTFDGGLTWPPCPIPAGQTVDFTTIPAPSTAGIDGWVCYELQAPRIVVRLLWRDPSAGDNGFIFEINELTGATREVDPVGVTLTDAAGTALTFEQAKSAASVVAQYTVRLKPEPAVQADAGLQPGVDATPIDGSNLVGKPAAPAGDKRQDMLDIIQKWMPTSLNNPMVPSGEKEDLLAKASWTKATGLASKKVKDDNVANGTHNPIVTSCGDVLKALLDLWRSDFLGAFLIRDRDAKNHKPGAKDLGYYVEADGVKAPTPGDIIVLRNGFGPRSVGSIGHVGVLVSISSSEWQTADGGGGALPDQTAAVTKRTVKQAADNSLILVSVTDGKEKQLDGWINLDLVPRHP